MNIFRQFFRLASPFWLNKNNWFTWAIFISCVVINLLIVKVYVYLNTWNKSFFDALTELDGPLIYDLLFEFIIIIAVIVAMKVYAKWLQQWVEIRWRTWITENLVKRWMSNKRYYHLTLTSEPDNPDQRIAEDAKLLTTDTIELLMGLIKSTATLLAFSMVLWEVSEGFAIPVFDGFAISGYLFWVALIYSIVGACVTHFFGHQLHGLYYQQQKKEATFRASLLRKRDHAEQIAFMQGATSERNSLENDFKGIALNWKSVMGREKTLGIIINSYHQVASMVPYFAAIPSLMAKAITVGGLFQVKMAFMKVYASFSWFILRYDDLSRWSATVSRLGQFLEALDTCDSIAKQQAKQTNSTEVNNVTITTPSGHPLLQDVNFSISGAQSLLLKGPSGLGKSTLLRTLSGIWPFYEGKIQIASGRVSLLPQKPYLPMGSLRACLSYPDSVSSNRQDYIEVLKTVGLLSLCESLDAEQEWANSLSGGEQQKVALARVLLQKPDVLIMDEATNQLDESSAQALLKILMHRLPQAQIMMVSHQMHLQPLFDQTIDLSFFRAQGAVDIKDEIELEVSPCNV